MKDGYMSGSELRQYLHISTRKMKYLMDHNLIRHENTGQTTHKYRVPVEDAEDFKERMVSDKILIAELSGKFPSGNRYVPPPPKIMEITAKNCKAFARWLNKEWAELPEALPTQTAAKITGIQVQRLHDRIRNHELYGIMVNNRQYCRKTEIIELISEPVQMVKSRNKILYQLIGEFLESSKK